MCSLHIMNSVLNFIQSWIEIFYYCFIIQLLLLAEIIWLHLKCHTNGYVEIDPFIWLNLHFPSHHWPTCRQLIIFGPLMSKDIIGTIYIITHNPVTLRATLNVPSKWRLVYDNNLLTRPFVYHNLINVSIDQHIITIV